MTEEKRKRGRPPGGGKKKPEIRKIDPVPTEVVVAMYNAEHPNQHTEISELTPDEVKEKFGDFDKEYGPTMHIQTRERKMTYNPYDNPRFKSKNGIDKDKK